MVLSRGLSIPTPHLRVRDSLTSHLREKSKEEEQAQPQEEKAKLLVQLLLCANTILTPADVLLSDPWNNAVMFV